MAPNSCTVAVKIAEYKITIHFKSDDELKRIYVLPDNIVLTSGTRSWSKRCGKEYKLYQNKHQARVSLKKLCQALKEDRDSSESLGTDEVVAKIYEEIGMSPSLDGDQEVGQSRSSGAAIATRAITIHSTGGLIGWQ
jgi:hypothetical protein